MDVTTISAPDAVRQHSFNQERVRDCYDRTAAAYARQFLDELDHKPFDREILARFAAGIPCNGLVSEMGCGVGHIARYLRDQHRLNIRGVDLSSEMVKLAQALHPEIPFAVDNMLELSLPDASLDGVVAFYAIVHFGLREVEQALGEFHRVLKPDGSLLFSFHTGSEIVRVTDFLDTPGACADWVFFDVDDIVKIVESTTFIIDEVIVRYPYIGTEHPSRRCYILVHKQSI